MNRITPPDTNRRRFLSQTLGASAALTATPLMVHGATDTPGQNERVRVGIIGAGGRGGELSNALAKISAAHVVAIADPDLDRAEKLARKFDGAVAYQDLRKLIDDPKVEAVVVATCNHWHCLASMWAIAAGKDVYVEKPLGHSQWEGRQVADAAAATGRIVQLGTQQRSDPIQMQARKFLHDEAALGAVKFVKANRLGVRGPIGKRDTPTPIPESVDYDVWLGPAADEPMFRDQLHYDWHWNFNTGSGEMGNWGVHILDDIRNVAYQDSVSTPTAITTLAGRVAWDDAGTTPNVHVVHFETESFPTFVALSNLPTSPTGKAKSWQCAAGLPHNGPGSGYVIACEGGYYLGQRGRGEAVDLNGKTIRKFQEKTDTVRDHMANFIDAVRSRDAASLAAPILTGHHSSGWCNLANVAHRVAAADPAKSIGRDAAPPVLGALVDDFATHLKAFDLTLDSLAASPRLFHDPATERFVGDDARRANAFLKRDYRAGYVVPAADSV